MNRSAKCGAGLLFAGLLAGCGDVVSPTHPLNPQSFLVRAPDADQNTDKTWPSLYNTARPTPAPATDSGRVISKTVRDEVVAPGTVPPKGEEPTTEPTTAPAAAQLAGNSTGVDQVVGGVMGDVDSNPIYADKVLAVIDRALAAEARKYNATQFRQVAVDMIQRQLMEFVHAEVAFAAAKEKLEAKDEQIATQETIRWRQEQIAHAGGSVELAKRHAIDNGTTLEEMTREHYRLTMTQIYYQRRVVPQIQISASDIRAYYEANRGTQFTKPAQVRIRLIRIDVAKMQDRDAAMEKILRLRQRLENGADFATVAGETNDDPLLLQNQGDPSPGKFLGHGALRSKKVDEAVWSLQQGQITPVIDDGSSLYLGKLEERKGGTVQPFEDQDVQSTIYETLRRQQFNALREQLDQELEKQAAIHINREMLDAALQMVMQKYPQWASAR